MQESGATDNPRGIDWLLRSLPSLTLSDTRTAVFFVAHGYLGQRGLPARDQHKIAESLGILVETAHRNIMRMVQRGILREFVCNGDVFYSLNPEWQPYVYPEIEQ